MSEKKKEITSMTSKEEKETSKEKKEFTSDDLKIIREKKFTIMMLKEEWERTEKRLVKRKSLMLAHISASSLTILVCICLLIILKYNASNKILNIVASSVTAGGGILALIKAIIDKVSVNKDSIAKVIQVVKNDGNLDKIELINMKDEELRYLPTERHKNYIKFLGRINWLIGLEGKIGIWFVIIMSLFIIILAVITFLVSISPVVIPLPNLSQHLAGGIIVSGTLWFTATVLSRWIKFFEVMSNVNWKSGDIGKDKSIVFRIFLFITILPALLLSIPFVVPLSIHYLVMQRTYVLEQDIYDIYFGEYKTENDDITFFGTEIDAKLILKLVHILGQYFDLIELKNDANNNENNDKKDKEKYKEIIKYLDENDIDEEIEIIYCRIVVILVEKFKHIINELIEKLSVELKKFLEKEGMLDDNHFSYDVKPNYLALEFAKEIVKELDTNIDILTAIFAKELKKISKRDDKSKEEIPKPHEPSEDEKTEDNNKENIFKIIPKPSKDGKTDDNNLYTVLTFALISSTFLKSPLKSYFGIDATFGAIDLGMSSSMAQYYSLCEQLHY
ncbi:21704_t:CDS:2 [Dentiscutata erythropus]|uniref:21704_t:CDS:1 n=1 Tax=Dentiscutata erythropus TaxID=1348616 RepID=A0A9N9A3M6_9GLOM|nr:21704_t:CDS:2 [Dentiscutata erythropus]